MFAEPDAFFREQAKAPGMAASTGCVFGATVASLLGPGYVVGRLVREAAAGADVFLVIGGSLGLLSSSLTLLLLWVAYAITFHAVSWRLGGTAEFRTVFFLTGFGFLPKLFAGVVGLSAVVVATETVGIPGDPSLLTERVAAINRRPVITVARLVGVVFILWSGMLWTFAVRHATGLPLRRVVIPTVPPTLLSIAWELRHIGG